MTAIPLQQEVWYPESDGKPMAETDLHRREMVDLIEALDRRYRDTPDVYVAGNLLLYYVQGDPRCSVAPDVFVVRGVPRGNRPIYKLWEEGRSPCFVIEVTSSSTRGEDMKKKKQLYERLGVEEYFLHDPTGDYLVPRLQGFRLVGGSYQPIPPFPGGSLDSRTTGLTLTIEGTNLRLTDRATGEKLLWVQELDQRLRETEERLAAAERELARLRMERESAEG